MAQLSLEYIANDNRVSCIVNETYEERNHASRKYNINSNWDNFLRMRRIRNFLDRHEGQTVDFETSSPYANSLDQKFEEIKRLVDYHNRRLG